MTLLSTLYQHTINTIEVAAGWKKVDDDEKMSAGLARRDSIIQAITVQ